MSRLQFKGRAHSADVAAVLVVDGRRIALSKVGPGKVHFRVPQHLPEIAGRIELTVDGETRTWKVGLPHGAVPFDSGVETERI